MRFFMDKISAQTKAKQLNPEENIFSGFKMSQADYLFELGKNRSLSGDFLGSKRLLSEASSLYLKDKKYVQYMECSSILLRIYKELQDVKKITDLKDELVHLVWGEDIEITPRIHYTLGQCALYKNNLEEAREEFEKSFYKTESKQKEALKNKNTASYLHFKIESLFSRYGMIAFLIRNNNTKKARQKLAELKKLMLEINKMENPKSYFKQIKSNNFSEIYEIKKVLQKSKTVREKLELSVELLKGLVLEQEQKYFELNSHLWKCYENIQKSKDLCSIVSFFYYLGKNYMNMKEYNQASIFLNLTKKSIDSDNFKHLNSHLESCLEEFKNTLDSEYDLIVNLENNFIIEKNKGKISFKNQFILFDLFKMLLERNGEGCSKEEISSYLWNQEYDPKMHDNKIYVTIKRLRKLIEPDDFQPSYIFRGKNGYYLSKNTKVLLKQPTLAGREASL